VISDQLSVISS